MLLRLPLFLKYGDIAHFEDALRSWIEGN